MLASPPMLVVPFLIVLPAGCSLAQPVETPIDPPTGGTGCGTSLSGEITDLGPDGIHNVTLADPTIELEFFSEASVRNDTNNSVNVAQIVSLFEADNDPFHVGVYTKGDELDSETEQRTVSACTELTKWKVGKDYMFSIGHYMVEGMVLVIIEHDLFVVLDLKLDEVFHVVNDEALPFSPLP